ncbi:MAG: PLDc N-terminal domain-containing protein, partial [Chloroflexi bacterium]|nr:PLDc N-terminal domain-containing protein [Chloroflexota bacterium]
WVLIILFLQVLGAALYLLARRPQRLATAQS